MTQPQMNQQNDPRRFEAQQLQCFDVGMAVRRLEPGEVLKETDLYRSTTGKWEQVPCPGTTVIDNGVEFVRPLKVETEP